ncbi:DcrB/PsbP domain-containing protein [Algoriphagus pacificus]|uniref:DM13 domain-containing protein n=1 Tax=Algoriphagus pacificus TaxID=2811234 RepID=A0ABS3CP43_9BACT|nr:hypothetical protein [Algoriphagus pacificus]MBN7818020.1 hypothetical protein [Algoriphagus pacificus]
MKILMKISSIFLLVFVLAACSNSSEDMNPNIPDPTTEVKVTANVMAIKTGTLNSQSGTNTKGMIEIVSDDAGKYFLRLGKDFVSDFHTGTVTVYLSTTNKLKLSESGSFQLVSVVNQNGEHFFNLPNLPDSKFTHGIIWCGAAGIPFGNGEFN